MIPNESVRYILGWLTLCHIISVKLKNGAATVYTIAGGTGELRRKKKEEGTSWKERKSSSCRKHDSGNRRQTLLCVCVCVCCRAHEYIHSANRYWGPDMCQAPSWALGIEQRASTSCPRASILVCRYEKVKVFVAQSCHFLCNPMDYSPPGSSAHGISQARILEWVAISYFRGSSPPRDWTHVSRIGRRILYHCATWETHNWN